MIYRLGIRVLPLPPPSKLFMTRRAIALIPLPLRVPLRVPLPLPS